MIDCYNRRLAGWPITDHMRTELVQDTLKAAVATHGSPNGTIFHSDHESVYYSKTYTRLRGDSGVIQSMDALGTSADNTLAESFNTTMKREVLQDTACWANETTCRRQLFRWLIHYNTHRPHT